MGHLERQSFHTSGPSDSLEFRAQAMFQQIEKPKNTVGMQAPTPVDTSYHIPSIFLPYPLYIPTIFPLYSYHMPSIFLPHSLYIYIYIYIYPYPILLCGPAGRRPCFGRSSRCPWCARAFFTRRPQVPRRQSRAWALEIS